jgi:hypothetical protein
VGVVDTGKGGFGRTLQMGLLWALSLPYGGHIYQVFRPWNSLRSESWKTR